MLTRSKIQPSSKNENMSKVSKYFQLLVKSFHLPIKVDKEKKIISFKFASIPVVVFLFINGFFYLLPPLANYLLLDYDKLIPFYYKIFLDGNAIDALSTLAMFLSMATAVMCFWIFVSCSGILL